MKKYIVLLLSLLLLSSCASYTIREARDTIVYPEAGGRETKLSAIIEEKERLKLQAEAEKTNEYPDDLSGIEYPFYYNPLKGAEYRADDTIEEFSAILIPLGEEDLEDEAVSAIVSLLEKHSFTLTALTGSLSNQARVTGAYGKNAVTTEGGTIIFGSLVLEEMGSDYITLALTEKKRITIYTRDYHPVIDGLSTLDETLTLIGKLERLIAEPLVVSISNKEEEAQILFLTSIAPSSLDWTSWTDYSYREERSFLLSDMLLALNWVDTFASTRFSEETESGNTRKYGEYGERLDFIYTKNVIVTSSYVIPVENMETRSVVSTFILP